jgi:hypothetical protein
VNMGRGAQVVFTNHRADTIELNRAGGQRTQLELRCPLRVSGVATWGQQRVQLPAAMLGK